MELDTLAFFFQLAGAALVAITALNIVRWQWKYAWVPRRRQGPRLAERYGRESWALVTGASDGLGRAFARELAQAGFNLLLISRTQAKLDRLQAELESAGVKVRTLAVDLADASEANLTRIAAAAQDLDLSIVVNCAGATVHRRYADVPAAALRRLLAMNVATTAAVTHATLPLMLRHAGATDRRAALINVGSIVGRFYWPGTQLYGACKAFIDHLTIPLAYEYGDKLDVLSFQPTVMATAMATGTEPAAITISPEAAAHAALAHLGRYHSSHGHWRHALAAGLFRILPSELRNSIFLSAALNMGEVEKAKGDLV